MKNRNRENHSFANINLLGKCNVDCFFCLGKDLSDLFNRHNQLNIHFNKWKNFNRFLDICRKNEIHKIYITGQNTDSLLYKYLHELINYLQKNKFYVGLRTNGYLASVNFDIINLCKNRTGYSIHSLKEETNKKIMNKNIIPNWDNVFNNTKQCRVSIVINKYNINEFYNILKFVSKYPSVKYIQVRRISTDARYKQLKDDIEIYEKLFDKILNSDFERIDDFYLAQRFIILDKEVNFWRTTKTSISSINYFTDGTISDNYFIIEGYLKNYNLTQ